MVFKFSNINIDSLYNFGLSVNENAQVFLKDYLVKKFQYFLKDIGSLHEENFDELPFSMIFTDMEFNKQIPDENEESFINKHFYPKVFPEIKKLENGRIEFYTKYCFTLDLTLTPERTSSSIPYGTLKLGNKPVLYYIWVDIQELIAISKSI